MRGGKWVAVGALALVACADRGEPPLTSDEREAVARVYADSVRSLTAPLDSLCDARMPALARRLADSLYDLRIADIERRRPTPQ